MILLETIKNLKKSLPILALMALLSFFVACTKDIPKFAHEQDIRSSTTSSEHLSSLEQPDKEKIPLIIPSLIKKGHEIESNAESLMEDVVKPLSKNILLKENLANGFLNIDKVKYIFDAFNGFLLITLEHPSTRADALKIVKSYNDFIFFSCDQNNENCSNIDFFKKVLKMKLIVIAPIKYADGDRCELYPSIEEYYSKLEMAYVFLEQGVDYPTIDLYYLRCGLEYAVHLSNVYKKTNSIDIFDKRDEVLSLLRFILQNPNRILEPESSIGFYNRLWLKLSQVGSRARQQKNDDLLGVVSNLKLWIARSLIELNLNSADFIKIISDKMYDLFPNPVDIFSYHKMVSEINDKNPELLRLMGVKALNKKEDIHLKILNLIVNKVDDDFTVDEIYSKLPNKEVMKKYIKNFVQLIILYYTNRANLRMRPIFSNTEEFQSETPIERKLKEIKDNIVAIDLSAGAYTKIKRLRGFASRALRISKDEEKELGLSDEYFKSSIDYLLSHPHSMLIRYKLAEIGFNGELDVGQDKVSNLNDIKHDRIYPRFFLNPEPQVPVSHINIDNFESRQKKLRYRSIIFDYSNNFLSEKTKVFTPYQRLYAFNFLVRMNTFHILGISLEEFLKKLIDGMLWEYKKLVKSGHEKLADVEEGMEGSLADVKLVCEEEKERRVLEEKGEVYEPSPSYSFNINILDLKNTNLAKFKTFQDLFLFNLDSKNSTRSKSLLVRREEITFALFRQANADRLDQLRLGEAELMRHIKLLLTIYKTFRMDRDMSSTMSKSEEKIFRSGLQEQLDTFQKSIEDYKHKKRSFYTLLRKYNKYFLEGCHNALLARAIQINDAIYLKEIEHFKKVYKYSLAMMELPEKDREQYFKEEVEPELRFDDAVEAYGKEYKTGIDRITPKGMYLYSQLDSMRRIKKYLEEIAPEIKISSPEDTRAFHSSEFYPPKNMNTKTWLSIVSADTELPISEEEFIKMGMREFLSSGSSKYGTVWDEIVIGSVGDYVSSATYYLALLYKLGNGEYYSQDNTACLEQDSYSESRCGPIRTDSFIDLDVLIDRYLELSSIISISEKQEKILEVFGINERKMNLTPGYLNNLRTNTNVSFLRYAYDIIHYSDYFGSFSYRPAWSNLTVMESGTGESSVKIAVPERWRTGIWYDMHSYQYSLEKIKNLPFSIDKSISDIFIPEFRQTFRKALEMEKVFRDKAKKRELEDKGIFISYDFENEKPIYAARSHRVSMDRKRFYGPYLEDNSDTVQMFQEKINDFNQDTEYLFDETNKRTKE